MNWQKVWDHLFWMTKESRLETKHTDPQNLWNYNKWYEIIFIEVHKQKRKKSTLPMFGKRHKPIYSKISWISNQKKIRIKTLHNYLLTYITWKLKTNKIHGEEKMTPYL